MSENTTATLEMNNFSRNNLQSIMFLILQNI